MAGIRKISEELDRLQKKVASLREIYKLYPDTLVSSIQLYENHFYSESINKDVDLIRFECSKNWLRAYTSKIIGCIEVHSSPYVFDLLLYHPNTITAKHGGVKSLTIQMYHDTMKKHNIPDALIRDATLKVISFIKEKNIDLSDSNLKDANADSTLGKLLALL